MTDRLFDVPDLEPVPVLSRGQRLTRRNADQLAAGIHPATLRPLLESETPRTCGECAHHLDVHWNAGHFHKCECHRLGPSHSEHSDIRVGWPACSLFQPTTEESS